MPLNSRGEILYASSTCYRRMWRTFFYMLFFAAGSVWREGPAAQAIELPTTPAGWAGVLAAKFFVGHVISQFSVWAISYVSQLFVECWLRAYVKYFKPWSVGEHRRGTGGEEDGESKTYGTTHMRLVAITVVELAQDITGALVTAHGVPRLFDTLRPYTSLRI